MLTDFTLSADPAWPWPTLGFAGLALTLLTLWTYLGVKNAWRRIAVVLTLRLLALALAFLMLMRPSFAMTHLEGVEPGKWIVVLDASESMNVADVEGKPTRWQQVTKLFDSPEVKRRLERLANEQKIDVVKYLADADLRSDEPGITATGKRTDIGKWLLELRLKHGHDKQFRGVALFSDGADNGGTLSDEIPKWRNLAPIHTFGVGDPKNPRLQKDIALVSLRVADDKPVAVKAKFDLRAVAHAHGLKDQKVEITVTMEEVGTRDKKHQAKHVKEFKLTLEKDLPIELHGCEAPELAGEYKLTLKITKHPDETNEENNSISTFVHVIKEKLNVLWVDRLRVYEPTFAIRTLGNERNLAVRHVVVSKKLKGKPADLYELDLRDYDVIVVGDISAEQFCQGEPAFFDDISRLVREKKTGLLMLGGTETFARGGWHQHKAIMDLLPVTFDPAQPAFRDGPTRALPVKGIANFAFVDLLPEPKANAKLWNEEFDPLDGYAPLGVLANKATMLLERDKDTPMLAVTKAGAGRTAVFAGDSTSKAWIQRVADVEGNLTRDTFASYQQFWKSLVLWLAGQKDQGNPLWINLDQRRINLDKDEKLGFRFGLRTKDGRELPDAKFETKVIGPKGEHAVRSSREQQHQRGSFQPPKEPGEYQLVVKGTAGETSGEDTARFFVIAEDIEKTQALADHETLKRIASAGDHFHPATEAALLQVLDGLKTQAIGEGRLKTTHWPDWKRLPASEQLRDQAPGMFHSFALLGFVLFVGLIGCEWLLRRRWDLA